MSSVFRLVPLRSFEAGTAKLLCTINELLHPMRTYFPLPFALACIMAGAHPATAQVTILPTDVMQVGDRYRLAVDENPSVGFGTPGNNMTWILNGLNSTWDYTTQTMLAVDAPLGAVAPGTIALVTSLDNAAYHYDVDADELLYTGDSWDEDGMPMGLSYTPGRVQLKFPAQMGQQHSGTSRSVDQWYLGQNVGWGFVADSVRRRTHYDYSYVIDGWGNISTPFGFFPCIRVNTLITTTDSIDAKPAGSDNWVLNVEIMDMDTREVAFWSPQHSLPVVRMIDAGDVGMPSAVVWIAEQEISTGVREPWSAATFSIHPNPATDRIEVITASEDLKTYRLMTSEGKLVQQGLLAGQRATIPLEFLEAGIYILEVRDGKRVEQERLIKH